MSILWEGDLRDHLNGHTSAPWKIEKYSDTNARDGERIRSANGLVLVPEVWGASLSECDANYKLIAAAPEMLAALKLAGSALDLWLNGPGDANGVETDRALMAVNQAIRNAVAP